MKGRDRMGVKPAAVLFSVLLMVFAIPACAADLTVGREIAPEDVTDFYDTQDASFVPLWYQRYRFYRNNGTPFFFHETREGDSWPLTERDITASGDEEISEEAWQTFLSLIQDGTAAERKDELLDGDPGPWTYIYVSGGEEEGREFRFASPDKRAQFEAFCRELAGERMRIRVSDGTHTAVFELNDTPPAASLYGMLPLETEVGNYGSNEKIFYPPEALDVSGGLEGSGSAGGLALFSPWGNVVMYYDEFGAWPGLYLLGQAVEGTDEIKSMSGMIRVEKAE